MRFYVGLVTFLVCIVVFSVGFALVFDKYTVDKGERISRLQHDVEDLQARVTALESR